MFAQPLLYLEANIVLVQAVTVFNSLSESLYTAHNSFCFGHFMSPCNIYSLNSAAFNMCKSAKKSLKMKYLMFVLPQMLHFLSGCVYSTESKF